MVSINLLRLWILQKNYVPRSITRSSSQETLIMFSSPITSLRAPWPHNQGTSIHIKVTWVSNENIYTFSMECSSHDKGPQVFVFLLTLPNLTKAETWILLKKKARHSLKHPSLRQSVSLTAWSLCALICSSQSERSRRPITLGDSGWIWLAWVSQKQRCGRGMQKLSSDHVTPMLQTPRSPLLG